MQAAVVHIQLLVRRNDVDVVGRNVGRLRDLGHRDGRVALQQGGRVALGIRQQVEDNHERHAGIRGCVRQEVRQRLQPAGRRAEPHERKGSNQLEVPHR